MPASSFRRLVIALGPLIVIGMFLLAKLVCFSIRVNLGTAWFHGAFVDSGAGPLAASSLPSSWPERALQSPSRIGGGAAPAVSSVERQPSMRSCASSQSCGPEMCQTVL